jgi:hypothetical protein
MKKFILGFSTVILLISCKKSTMPYTFSGQLISCSSTSVYPNVKLELVEETDYGTTSGKIVATTNTDNSGNFSFSYNGTNIKKTYAIRTVVGFGYDEIIGGITEGNISDLKIYTSFKYHLIVSLNVIKPYTNNDTLFMAKYTANGTPAGLVKVAGPFASGRKFTFPNLDIETSVYAPKYSGTLHTYNCLFNTTYGTSGLFDKDYILSLPTKCNGDSVYVNVDIK